MTLLSILALTFGTLGGIANAPQWYKIFRRKSAKDISIITYSILLIGAVVWIFYGIEIDDFPIIISNALGAVNIGAVVVGCLLYGRE